MATAEQMAGYAAQLNAHTEESSKNKLVTEVCLFRLLPEFAKDHAAVAAKFESNMVSQCKPGSPHARGIRRISWGFASDDPAAFVWMLDWDKIQDHWDFWQTPGFPPVIEAISTLFEPGRPLVRHYDFGEAGMLDNNVTVARVMVWDDGEEGKQKQKAKEEATRSGKPSQFRGGYAVDVNETSWWCSLLGYESEADAKADAVPAVEGAVSHIFHLTYA